MRAGAREGRLGKWLLEGATLLYGNTIAFEERRGGQVAAGGNRNESDERNKLLK